jgi:hypothetical protein
LAGENDALTQLQKMINTLSMNRIFQISIILTLFFAACVKTSSDASGVMTNTVGGTGGSLARFSIVGNYLYTVDKQQLKTFSLVDPANPTLVNTADVGFEIETIFPFKDKLFIGSTSVVHIFSIADPVRPQRLSTAISPTVMRRCDPVVAKDTVAYATLRTNGPCGGTNSQLVSFDIRAILNPVQKSNNLVTEPYGLGYSDTTLYVCEKSGLYVFNIKNAFLPVQKAIVGTGEWYIDVIPYGGVLICWTNEGVVLYDISLPEKPQFIKKIV